MDNLLQKYCSALVFSGAAFAFLILFATPAHAQTAQSSCNIPDENTLCTLYPGTKGSFFVSNCPAYQSALTEYNSCINHAEEATTCASASITDSTSVSLNANGVCTPTCASGYYLTVSNTCVAEPTNIPVVTTPVITTSTNTTPTPIASSAAPVVISTQTQVTQTAVLPAQPTQSRTIYNAIAQAISPKPVQSVQKATNVSATTSESTSAPTASQPVAHQRPRSTSFWAKVGNFLANFNPLRWF